jgi:DNA invertase Pin-like site-specific DNA recombinase
MIDFVAYMRVSTDKQGITGLGMDAQRESVLRYVSTRGRLLAEFIEVESGRKDNRPQLRAALEECRKRRAVLLIARLDRLARNVAFIANLMNSDVEFVAVDMPQANRLTIHILAAVAEHEREMISQRTKAALAAAKARGIKLGNPRYQEALARARAALGYKPPPPEVVSLISEWRGQGDALRRIAARLNDLNVRTPQACRWYASTVRTVLLKNESAKERKSPMTNARYDDVALEHNDAFAQERNHPSAPMSVLPVSTIRATPSVFASTGREAPDEVMPRQLFDKLLIMTAVSLEECKQRNRGVKYAGPVGRGARRARGKR